MMCKDTILSKISGGSLIISGICFLLWGAIFVFALFGPLNTLLGTAERQYKIKTTNIDDDVIGELYKLAKSSENFVIRPVEWKYKKSFSIYYGSMSTPILEYRKADKQIDGSHSRSADSFFEPCVETPKRESFVIYDREIKVGYGITVVGYKTLTLDFYVPSFDYAREYGVLLPVMFRSPIAYCKLYEYYSSYTADKMAEFLFEKRILEKISVNYSGRDFVRVNTKYYGVTDDQLVPNDRSLKWYVCYNFYQSLRFLFIFGLIIGVCLPLVAWIYRIIKKCNNWLNNEV